MHTMQEKMMDPDLASDPQKYQEVAKQAKKMEDGAKKFEEYQKVQRTLVDTESMLEESKDDEDLLEMVQTEIAELRARMSVRLRSHC
jgi:peptide chain release factor 1